MWRFLSTCRSPRSGRVGIIVGYDGAWLKPGKARNSQEGVGTAIGALSGHVVACGRRTKQCSRCKPGAPCGRVDCQVSHVGSSGSMFINDDGCNL